MNWDETPPTTEEMNSPAMPTGSWDSAPPGPEELEDGGLAAALPRAAAAATKQLLGVPGTVARAMIDPQSQAQIVKKMGPAVPIAGGIAFGPIGAAAGEFVRQAANTIVNPEGVPKTALGRFGSVVGQGAQFVKPAQVLKEVPGAQAAATWVGKNVVTPVAQTLSKAGTAAARRALGFSKRFLKRPGNMERANEVANAALEEGIIRSPITHPFSTGTESMLERTEQLSGIAGKRMGMTRQVLDANQVAGPDPIESAAKVIQQLNPRFPDELRVAREITRDMGALGENRLSYQEAFSVLQKLQQKAKFPVLGNASDQLKAKMYQRAYGIFRSELDKAIDRGAMMLGDTTGKTLASYKKAKRLFGVTEDAEKALLNRLSSEAGNNRIGLREAMLATGELATGHPIKAAAAIGAIEGFKRVGNAGIATTARSVGKILGRGIEAAPEVLARPGLVPTAGQTAYQALSPTTAAPAAMILTEEKAREYLKKTKGDKEKARQLAAGDGWIF